MKLQNQKTETNIRVILFSFFINEDNFDFVPRYNSPIIIRYFTARS